MMSNHNGLIQSAVCFENPLPLGDGVYRKKELPCNLYLAAYILNLLLLLDFSYFLSYMPLLLTEI